MLQTGQHRMMRWLDYVMESFSSSRMDWTGFVVPMNDGLTPTDPETARASEPPIPKGSLVEADASHPERR
jgi:hypothetical protein